MGRGTLVVLEGCDRSGKSTQCRRLVENLNKSGIRAKMIAFPDRTTIVGKVINSYLSKEVDLPDQAIHLLFSANRWELKESMNNDLSNGITLIVDRYSYSGVAYSASKPSHSLSAEWFKAPEEGLLKPDVTFYLHLEEDVINKRKGFGNERYETTEFQTRVKKYFDSFESLKEWKVVDANKTVDELQNELFEFVKKMSEDVKNKPISTLW